MTTPVIPNDGLQPAAFGFDHIHKTYPSKDGQSVIALQDVSFHAAPGEFLTVVGPSGCGKSTLLRILAGIGQASSGTVSIAGRAINGPSRDIGVVFQSPVLLPWRTVLQNVLVPAEVQRRDMAVARRRAQDYLDMVGLQGFENKYPRELSGGMQQRVAICCALLNDPDLLLMDEPFGALDALTREEMTLELLRIWAVRPKTVVFDTHSISEAVLLADRVVVMSARPGRIADVIDITLPRPRAFNMSALPAFTEASERIREQIFKRSNVPAHD